jgi:uncharacterized RDD family membrane protein YckC
MNVLSDETPRPRDPTDFPPHGPNSLASIGERGMARTLDTLIELIPLTVLVAVFIKFDTVHNTASLPSWVLIAWLAMLVVYEAVMVTWRGQTVGKLVFGVRVAYLVNGKKPDPFHAALRIMLPAIVLAFPPTLWFLYPVVYLTAAFTPMRRGVHDQAAGSVVVRTR